jgi:hypothetical protein
VGQKEIRVARRLGEKKRAEERKVGRREKRDERMRAREVMYCEFRNQMCICI